jgi:3-oxoacyl-[acyl-carrier-protein] synthase II
VIVNRRRVVVTGLGHVSPIGNTTADGWNNLVAGKSGIGKITKFDASSFSSQIAGEVRGFIVGEYLAVKESRRMDLFMHYGIAAGMQAIVDSGITVTPENAERIGVIIGSGIGGLPLIEDTQIEYLDRGPRRISPFFVPASIINMISGNLSIMYGLKGPSLAIVSACTTGTHSIGEAFRMIQHDEADIMIAGGAESTVSPLGIGGFAALRALSQRNDDPTTASRPWDKDRDGFVLGEGAGVLLIEGYEHAKARGANIYCELVGYGRSSDAHHITAPCDDGEGAYRCMKLALKDARLDPDAIAYINAHGTSTGLGDIAETIAIKRAFGGHAKSLVVNSTKSMTGHLLGASGGVEAVYSALAIKNQVSPPTINIFNQDPDCDLDYSANFSRDLRIGYAMSNSFGFGGTNGTLIFARV